MSVIQVQGVGKAPCILYVCNRIMSSSVLISSPINDTWYPIEAVSATNHLIKLKRENSNDIWIVIDAVIALWGKRYPGSWKSFIITTKKTRGSRKDSFGSNRKAGLRYTLDMPEWVHHAIRRLYSTDELRMDKEFFKAFWKRYPAFRVSERS